MRWEQMSVGIPGLARLTMSHSLLYHFGMNSQCEQKACKGVSEVVKPDAWQARLLQQWSEGTCEKTCHLDRSAYPIAEDPALIIPCCSCCQSCLVLTCTMVFEYLNRVWRQVNETPTFGGLRL